VAGGDHNTSIYWVKQKISGQLPRRNTGERENGTGLRFVVSLMIAFTYFSEAPIRTLIDIYDPVAAYAGHRIAHYAAQLRPLHTRFCRP
jgi:hypothetical protein